MVGEQERGCPLSLILKSDALVRKQILIAIFFQVPNITEA